MNAINNISWVNDNQNPQNISLGVLNEQDNTSLKVFLALKSRETFFWKALSLLLPSNDNPSDIVDALDYWRDQFNKILPSNDNWKDLREIAKDNLESLKEKIAA